MCNSGIILRPATIEDADLLLEWRNDPETRDASHNGEEIVKESHIVWLLQTLENPDRKLFIFEENGVRVGTVRIDLLDGVSKLSWTTAPNARGRGVAKRMVALLANEIEGPIRAEIKIGNKGSARVAIYAGMELEKEVNGIQHFKRPAL